MSEDRPASQEPFDLDKLRELIEMMEKHGLTEISLRRGDEKWSLRRGPQEVTPMMPPAGGYPPVAQPGAAQQPPPAASGGEASGQEQAAAAEKTVDITSPTVGTFYAAPSPDDPSFVEVGSHVNPDTVVCVVEAMKVFNQIPAETSGTIVEILVENGEPVEYGQALFRVRPD